MKEKIKALIIGLMIGAMISSGMVFAKQTIETIEVAYDNIKILIDGKEYQPTDVNGNIVEPFIYRGTTYLPVRALANAFDKEVDWEPQTSTVTLGSKNYDWLDQIGYADYEISHKVNTLSTISIGTMDNSGIKHDRGLKFYLSARELEESNDGTVRSYQTIEYLLNKNYNTLSGKFISLCSDNAQGAIVKFYGDGKLLYTSPVISYGTKATPFEIDISNYKILKIHTEIPNVVEARITSGENQTFGIAEARLLK